MTDKEKLEKKTWKKIDSVKYIEEIDPVFHEPLLDINFVDGSKTQITLGKLIIMTFTSN